MSDNETTDATKTTVGKDEEPEEEEEEEDNVRDISESSQAGDAVMATTKTPKDQDGLLDTQILNITSGDQYGNRGSTVALTHGKDRLTQPRVTRFLYFYFMLGFFLV